MAEFPALPVFTDAYLADTRHLTAEEHGAYLLLLMCAWRTRGCQLKDDDRFLARTVGVSPQKWRRLKPVIREFFTVEGGLWRQKKLMEVYRGVEARVSRNRENGAKGGRAKAAKKAADRQTVASGEKLATKTENQNPEPKQQQHAAAAALFEAAGLDEGGADISELERWLAAGADMEADILPTIRRISARETKRAGRPPSSLAYYSAAILEARDKRLNARKAGQAHADQHPAPPPKQAFDEASPAHWRQFLGASKSRFRGDYLSQHWRIGADHPDFLPHTLGPDPKVRLNPMIPAEILAEYGPAWGWVLPESQGA